MNITRDKIYFILLFFISANFLSAQTITAIKSDDWSKSETWDLNRKPQFGDTVVIDGFEVTLDESALVAAIKITNASDSGDSALKFESGSNGVLGVFENIYLNAENNDNEVELYIADSDSIFVVGDFNFTRASDNDSDKHLKLSMYDSSKLVIQGDFNIYYGNSDKDENGKDIHLHDAAFLRVQGKTNILMEGGEYLLFDMHHDSQAIFEKDVEVTMSGGNDLIFKIREDNSTEIWGDFKVTNANNNIPSNASNINIEIDNNGGSLLIKGDLSLNSSSINQVASATIDGTNSVMSVRGDIILDADDDADVGIYIESNAKVNLGGSVQRLSPSKFGEINMDANTTWIYDGEKSQIIACTENSVGTDAFQFSNIEFKNTSGEPLILEGELFVEEEIMLEKGIIQSSVAAPLIIGDQAKITGGNELAYIDGPIRKEGRTENDGFTFPIGNAGVYAPLSISEVNNPNAEYTAQYLGCPPPLSGSLLQGSLANVSGVGYWEFNRGESSPEADVTLHWSDAGAQGISDMNDLAVAIWDTDILKWKSISDQPGVDNGDNTGYVTNALGCPPPLSGSRLTFGSKDGVNALPVVLSAFDARAKGQIVDITWETASEFNSDYFVVERSANGLNFEAIKNVAAVKNSNQLTRYAERDFNPGQGKNYYRLCQVDLMGMKVYSSVVLVDFESDAGFIVFPNPVKDVLQVRGDFEAKVYVLEFFDTAGRLLSQQSAMAENGFLKIETRNLNLPKTGIYFMRVKHGKRLETIPFIKD